MFFDQLFKIVIDLYDVGLQYKLYIIMCVCAQEVAILLMKISSSLVHFSFLNSLLKFTGQKKSPKIFASVEGLSPNIKDFGAPSSIFSKLFLFVPINMAGQTFTEMLSPILIFWLIYYFCENMFRLVKL